MKTAIVIKCLCISILLIGFGCKKKSKELTTVNFHLYNPVTNEAFAGVKVSILQEKNTSSGFNSGSETEVVWEGVTDANGKASYSFKAYNSTKYSYWQYAEKAFTSDPNLHKLQQPAFLPLNKNEVNEVVYKMVKSNVYIYTWVKNTNCFNQFDKMRWRIKSLADIFDNWGGWSPAGMLDYFEGCYENTHTHTHTGYLGY